MLISNRWGFMVFGMGFVHDWRALTVLRAFLGVFEAGLFPGAIFIIGSWYRQFETGRRIAIFYMASLLSSGFSGIFAYALSLISVGNGMWTAGWRWVRLWTFSDVITRLIDKQIFLIEGIVTVVAGLIAPFFLIEFPEKVKFLNAREKHIAATRVLLEKQGKEVYHPTTKETLVMLMDWKIGCYALQYFICASSVYSLAFFYPIIVREGFGFSYAKTQLLSAPPYVFTIFMSLAAAYISDKVRMRWPIMVGQSMIGIIGLLVIVYAGPPAVRYFGFFLAVYGTQGNIPSTLAYGQNQTGRVEKRGVVAAAMISAGAVGGICGSTIFRSQDAPNYYPGMWSTIAMQLVYSAITLSLSFHFRRLNRLADEGKRPALERVEGFRYAP